jgi:ribosome-associated protein
METVFIDTEIIKLEQFLKFCGEVGTGGNAKLVINDGLVKVNGEVEKRRGRKLKEKDIVEFQGKEFKVDSNKSLY